MCIRDSLYRQAHSFDLKTCMLKQHSNGTERRLRCMDNALGRIRFCNDPYEHQAKVAGTAKLERKYFDDLPCFLHYLRLANVCTHEHADPASPLDGESEQDALQRLIFKKLCIREATYLS